MESQTIEALAGLNDTGLFEKVAMAALRLLPEYAAIAHPGINVDGKTQRSPVDGICFVDSERKHMVVAHHTTTAAKSLEKKWLFDPASVNRRPTSKSPLPEPGDVLKTLEVVRAERRRAPDLTATLILTTNREPDDELIRDVVSFGRSHDINVDVWSRSAIASILDTRPAGQHIRRRLLGIEEELLSWPLLAELSMQNIGQFDAQDDIVARVARRLDEQLIEERRPILFLASPSGTGKTVACHKFLSSRVAAGELAFVIPHQIVEAARSLDQALMETLRQMKPSLAKEQTPSHYFELNRTVILLIEDVNASTDPRRVIEKVAGWQPSSDKTIGHFPWAVICPVWPHLLASVSSQTKSRIASMEFRPEDMSADEASAAVLSKASLAGVQLHEHQAKSIAAALGHDPLLIALNDNWMEPNGELTIRRFAEDVIERAGATGPLLAADLGPPLIDLGIAMLKHPGAPIVWKDLENWQLTSAALAALRQIARNGELFRLQGPSTNTVIKFRHDRVRDWLLVEAAALLHNRQELGDAFVAEPMLAEVMASVLLRAGLPPDFLARVAWLNPLALFHAIRLTSFNDPRIERLVEVTRSWLIAPENQGRATKQLRWQALAAISDVSGEHVLSLVKLLPSNWVPGMIARMRNGDIEGGVDLCLTVEPHTAVVWLKSAIDAVRVHHETAIEGKLSSLLLSIDVSDSKRMLALLNLAGIWGSARLGEVVLSVWDRDNARADRLDTYLWALARCSTKASAARMLGELCQAWSELPEVRDGNTPSPKDEMASDWVRWAFERAPPLGALPFLMERAGQADLAWQIEYLLHGLDVPNVILFQARCAAERRRKSVESYSFNNPAVDYWRYAKDRGMKTMSAQSRAQLFDLWSNSTIEQSLRFAAFDLWSMNSVRSELPRLAVHADDKTLADRVFRRRAELGDPSIIPALILKLTTANDTWYWHYTQYVWSAELYDALNDAFGNLCRPSSHEEKKADLGFTLVRVLLRLEMVDAERLLLKYWDHLGSTPKFVQAALHVGSPELLTRAQREIANHPAPDTLFKHLTMHYGVRTVGEAGITREAQILALAPYLDFVEASDLSQLAEVCNENGWFATRVRWLDPRLEDDQDPLKRMLRSFDEGVRRGWSGGIKWDIERLFEAGMTWDVIKGHLTSWLATQSSAVALETVSESIQLFGRREDIALLSRWRGADAELISQVAQDAQFAVSRRTF